MAYDAKKIYYRFDDHLSRLVLDYEASRQISPESESLYHGLPTAPYDEDLFVEHNVKRGLRNLDGTGVLRTGLLCAILHESAHALVYRKLWHRWPDLALSPFGICLQLRGVPMTPEEELRLAAAGPLANLLACCTVLLYMQTAGQYSYSGYWFACTNLLAAGK